MIALDLIALDPPVQHHQICTGTWTEVELLDDAGFGVGGVHPRSASTQGFADIAIEHRPTQPAKRGTRRLTPPRRPVQLDG